MKKMALLGLGMALAANVATADCNPDLYGKWVVSHTSASLDSGLEKAEMPLTWTFTEEGKATIDMPPFLNKTNDFECEGDSVVIKKTVPTTLNIERVSDEELVWIEEGDGKYFYFSKK